VKNGQEALETRLFGLRSAFDAAFARKAEAPTGERHGYLGIRLNDTPYALDLDEVASVKKRVVVTPLPSDELRLLGVAGIDGTLAAVYDLGALLGLASSGAPVWFALVRGSPVVVAFHALEGQLHPDLTGTVAETADGEDASSDVFFRPGLSRPVIRLGVLVAKLRSVVTAGRREGAASR
jgi:hypothetical protein